MWFPANFSPQDYVEGIHLPCCVSRSAFTVTADIESAGQIDHILFSFQWTVSSLLAFLNWKHCCLEAFLYMSPGTLVQQFPLGVYLEVGSLGQIYKTMAQCFLMRGRSGGVSPFTLPQNTWMQLTASTLLRVRQPGPHIAVDPIHTCQVAGEDTHLVMTLGPSCCSPPLPKFMST